LHAGVDRLTMASMSDSAQTANEGEVR